MLDLAERSNDVGVLSVGGRPEDSPARRDRMLFARRDNGDRRARDELIERFLPLARSLARRYEHSGEPLDDLVQVASLALLKAIDRYDPDLGYAFSSYAVPTIHGELKRHLRNHSWAVRPPRDLQELALRVEHATTRLTQHLDRAPTLPELANATNSSDHHVLQALQARRARGAISLHTPAGDDDHTLLQDTLPSNDDAYARADMRILLDTLLNDISPRTREILRLRYTQDLTQAQIATMIGVGEMQISRIIRKAIDQLHHNAHTTLPTGTSRSRESDGERGAMTVAAARRGRDRPCPLGLAARGCRGRGVAGPS
jgi:RNA polymerase sigma-B factor